MRKLNMFYIICLCVLSFTSCDLEIIIEPTTVSDECISDVSVISLEAPTSVFNGESIQVDCIIENIIQSGISTCTTSDEGEITVTRAYSSTYQDQLDDYEIKSVNVYDMDSYEMNEGRSDEMVMNTDGGAGYYAMKVEVNTGNDNNAANDSRMVIIQAY